MTFLYIINPFYTHFNLFVEICIVTLLDILNHNEHHNLVQFTYYLRHYYHDNYIYSDGNMNYFPIFLVFSLFLRILAHPLLLNVHMNTQKQKKGRVK